MMPEKQKEDASLIRISSLPINNVIYEIATDVQYIGTENLSLYPSL